MVRNCIGTIGRDVQLIMPRRPSISDSARAIKTWINDLSVGCRGESRGENRREENEQCEGERAGGDDHEERVMGHERTTLLYPYFKRKETSSVNTIRLSVLIVFPKQLVQNSGSCCMGVVRFWDVGEVDCFA